MKQLFNGIYAIYNAGGDFATNTTGLYLFEAPQGTAYPYATYKLVSGSVEHFFDGLEVEEPLVQFDIYDEDTDSSTIGGIYDDLKTMFDDALISVTGYGRVLFSRTSHTVLRHPEDNIWQYSADYEVILTKS